MEIILTALTQLVPQLPVLLVYLIGIVLAVARWQQHPRVSLLVVIAFGLLLFDLLVGAFVVILPAVLVPRYAWGATEISVVFAVFAIIRSVITAVASGLLLWAIFSRHQRDRSLS